MMAPVKQVITFRNDILQFGLRFFLVWIILFYTVMPASGRCRCRHCSCHHGGVCRCTGASYCSCSQFKINSLQSKTCRHCSCGRSDDCHGMETCYRTCEIKTSGHIRVSSPYRCSCHKTDTKVVFLKNSKVHPEKRTEIIEKNSDFPFLVPLNQWKLSITMKAFETPVSRLPVRLHLILSVLRN